MALQSPLHHLPCWQPQLQVLKHLGHAGVGSSADSSSGSSAGSNISVVTSVLSAAMAQSYKSMLSSMYTMLGKLLPAMSDILAFPAAKYKGDAAAALPAVKQLSSSPE